MAGGDKLRLIVVTPERTLLDEPVAALRFPLYDGDIGILPGRLPLIGRLGAGELHITATSGETSYFVDGGFVQIRDDVVTVLTNRATPANKVDTAAAAKELELAHARRALTDGEQAEKAKAIARARAQLRIASVKS